MSSASCCEASSTKPFVAKVVCTEFNTCFTAMMPGRLLVKTAGPSMGSLVAVLGRSPLTFDRRTLLTFPLPSSAVGWLWSQHQLPSTTNLYCSDKACAVAGTVAFQRPSGCFWSGKGLAQPSHSPRATTSCWTAEDQTTSRTSGAVGDVSGEACFLGEAMGREGQLSVKLPTPEMSLYQLRSKTTDGFSPKSSSYPRTLPMLLQLAAVRAALGRASRGSRFSLGVWLSCVQSNSKAGQPRGLKGSFPEEMSAKDALRVKPRPAPESACCVGRRDSVGMWEIAPMGCDPQREPWRLFASSPGLLHCMASRISALMPRVPW
mmetsp:Transcript_33140/g.71521  ORF Transcript_33140/g.71521 Transcript_33140/m.71521 type:complete len:319 (-) Transcript_33140:1139-2095(-)